MIRIAQLGLVLAAAMLWGASRMTWVEVTSFDGLGQPKTVALSGGSWSTALLPLAVLLLATAIAALAVRGWPLRMLAVLAAITSAGMAYLAISLWVIRDVAVRASHLAEAPVADLVGDPAALRRRGDHRGGRCGHARMRGSAAAIGDQGAFGRGPLRTSHGRAIRRTGRRDVGADAVGRARRRA